MGGRRLWDTAAIGMLVLTLITLAYTILVGLDPASPLNAFPPPTTVMIMMIPSATQGTPPASSTIPVEPGSHTPSPSVTPALAPTLSRKPTSTRPLTTTNASPTRQITTPTKTPSPTRAPFTFTALVNYQVHPVLTCEWTGLAGTIVDLKGEAVRGYVVCVTGADGLSQQVAVSTSPDYGPGGWEVRLGGRGAKGTWQVQLYKAADLETPFSASYEIVLPGECQKNLAFVRFQQNH